MLKTQRIYGVCIAFKTRIHSRICYNESYVATEFRFNLTYSHICAHIVMVKKYENKQNKKCIYAETNQKTYMYINIHNRIYVTTFVNIYIHTKIICYGYGFNL